MCVIDHHWQTPIIFYCPAITYCLKRYSNSLGWFTLDVSYFIKSRRYNVYKCELSFNIYIHIFCQIWMGLIYFYINLFNVSSDTTRLSYRLKYRSMLQWGVHACNATRPPPACQSNMPTFSSNALSIECYRQMALRNHGDASKQVSYIWFISQMNARLLWIYSLNVHFIQTILLTV